MSDTKQKEFLTTNNTIDLQIAMKVVRVIMTPFTQLDAYKHGIIDKKGNQIKPSHEFKTYAEKEAFSPLMKLLIRIKQLFIQFNVTRAQAQPFVTLAGALKYIRENETLVGFQLFLEKYEPSDDEILFVEQLCEEMGAMPGSSTEIYPLGRTTGTNIAGNVSIPNEYVRHNLETGPKAPTRKKSLIIRRQDT